MRSIIVSAFLLSIAMHATPAPQHRAPGKLHLVTVEYTCEHNAYRSLSCASEAGGGK